MNTNLTGQDFEPLFNQLDDEIQQLGVSIHKLLTDIEGQPITNAVSLKSMNELFANEATQAIQQVEQGIRQVRQLQVLVDTSALMTSSLELDEVVENVLDTVVHITQATRIYLLLQQDSSDQRHDALPISPVSDTNLTLYQSRGWNQSALLTEQIHGRQQLIEKTLMLGTPVITDSSGFAPANSTTQPVHIAIESVHSIVCIPLILRGQQIGVLYADKPITSGLIPRSTLPILTAFANQAAIAIENARMFVQVKADLEVAREKAQRLKIQIDKNKTDTQIDEIANSDFFRKLQNFTLDQKDE